MGRRVAGSRVGRRVEGSRVGGVGCRSCSRRRRSLHHHHRHYYSMSGLLQHVVGAVVSVAEVRGDAAAVAVHLALVAVAAVG